MLHTQQGAALENRDPHRQRSRRLRTVSTPPNGDWAVWTQPTAAWPAAGTTTVQVPTQQVPRAPGEAPRSTGPPRTRWALRGPKALGLRQDPHGRLRRPCRRRAAAPADRRRPPDGSHRHVPSAAASLPPAAPKRISAFARRGEAGRPSVAPRLRRPGEAASASARRRQRPGRIQPAAARVWVVESPPESPRARRPGREDGNSFAPYMDKYGGRIN